MLFLTVFKLCPETRGVDEAAVEETTSVSCETSFSETILPTNKDSPSVRKGSIEDGAAKRCRVCSRNFDARCTCHVRVMRAGFVHRAKGMGP